jgi:hypothetical protein
MYHAPPMQPVAPLSAVDSPQGSGIAGVLVFAAMAAGMFWLYGKGGKMDWADMNRVLYMETRRRMQMTWSVERRPCSPRRRRTDSGSLWR